MFTSQPAAAADEPAPIAPVVVRSDQPMRRSGPAAAPALPRTTLGGSWTPLGPRPISTSYLGGSASTVKGQAVGNTAGRVTSLAVDPTNSAVVYAGTVGGGVWKTIDSGNTWTPISDNEASLAIGALAIDPSGQVIYAGTGEDNGSTSQYGQGILKSTDRGQSWTLLGQSTFAGHHIGSIAIDRRTSGSTQRVFAATDAGLFFSGDGGATWTRNTNILSATFPFTTGSVPSGGLTDIVQDPSTPSKFWAAISDAGVPCSTGTEAGNVAVSTDSGATWADVNHFPSLQQASRIELGVGSGGVAYVAFADCDGALADIQRTANGGASWTSLIGSPGVFNYFSGDAGAGGQGDYDNVVAVEPGNSAHAVFGGVELLATADGGGSFSPISHAAGCDTNATCSQHVDFHAIAFAGTNTFYVGSDGGVWRTNDFGGDGTRAHWANLNATFQTAELYHGTANTLQNPFGGTQDNGSSGNFPGDPGLPTWSAYIGGDGGFTAVDPTAGSSIAYGEAQRLNMRKVNVLTAALTPASPCDSYSTDANGRTLCNTGSVAERVSFVAPFVMDPTNPARLLAGTVRVWETTNGGVPRGAASWHQLSPDLTRGGTDVLSSIVIGPPGAQNVIYTGSRLGAIFRSTNGGANWTTATGNFPAFNSARFIGLPVVGGITFNPANADEAWATSGELGVGHVWHTTNAGAGTATVWKDISGSGDTGVPDAPAFAPLVDPENPNAVYVATYYGVRVCTTCGGAEVTPNWQALGAGLPNAAVSWLSLTRDNLSIVAWTRGRGAWSIARPQTSLGLSVTRAGTGTGAVTSSPSGISCGATCSGKFGTGSTVTLTASASPSSAFSGWGGDCSGTQATCTVTMSSARSVTATFTPLPPPTFAVSVTKRGTGTVTSTPAGIACGATCSATFGAGSQVSLLATASVGWRFSHWEVGCSTTSPTCPLAVTSAKSATAVFVPRSCIVPKLVRKKLAAAKLALRRAGCRAGKIKKVHSARVRKGRVVKQGIRRGKRRPFGTKVPLTVSRGP